MGALEAIVFDFDGVIADSERLHLKAYQDVLAHRGLTLSDEDYFAKYLGYDDGGVLRTFARDLGLPWTERDIADIVAQKMEAFARLADQGEMLFPGAARFITEAAEAVPLAIASGALTHEIEEILDRAGLRSRFAAIVGADQVMRSKPSPDPYLEAFHRMRARGNGLDPARTVAIEDSQWGLVSARTAGLRCVGVTNTYSSREIAAHAELVVSGLDALSLTLLDALCETPPGLGPGRQTPSGPAS
jgi:beta-phosphoglucomutase-like phosphatase (HAD superfamily)